MMHGVHMHDDMRICIRRQAKNARVHLPTGARASMHVRMSGIANQVRALRLRMGLKQRQFAEHVGVDQASISRWERGGNYTHENLAALAQLAGMTVDEFMHWNISSAASSDPRIEEPSLLDDLEVIGENDPDERANYEKLIRQRAAAVRAVRQLSPE